MELIKKSLGTYVSRLHRPVRSSPALNPWPGPEVTPSTNCYLAMHSIINRPALSPAICEALVFAQEARATRSAQRDHPLLVNFEHSENMAQEALDLELPENLIVIAALHDLLENGHCSTDQIARKFGKETAGQLAQISLSQNEIRSCDNLDIEAYSTRLQFAAIQLQTLKLLDWTQTLMHLCEIRSTNLVDYAQQVDKVLPFMHDANLTLLVRCSSAIRWAYRAAATDSRKRVND